MSQFLTDHDEIEDWLEKMEITEYEFRDQDPGAVYTFGYVDLTHRNLKFLPVQFGRTTGSFNISHNELTSLAGCPNIVQYQFNCSYNLLTSLENGPERISDYYDCSSNHLTSLDGAPKSGKSNFKFFCGNNADLKGALSVLLIEGLGYVAGFNAAVDRILRNHIADRDIFACQQELIDAGFEEYAQL